jgi:hypothetical protein
MSVSSMATRRVMHNLTLQKTLEQDGIVTLDFLNAADFLRLRQIVESLLQECVLDDVHLNTPFNLSAFNNSATWKAKIYEQIYDFLKDKLADLLDNYEPLVINIFDKAPNKGDSSVAIHQNPSFVQEPEHKSVSLWIPLLNVNRENGTLGVLKGSHDVFDQMRAANMPDTFAPIAHQLQQDWFEPIEIKEGQAALLDDSLIHWSYSNQSQQNRTAVQLICVPKETRHIYYYYDESGEKPMMNLYDVTKDFFFKFNCKNEPIGLTQFDSLPYKYESLTAKDLFDKVAPRNPIFAAKIVATQLPWWKRLFA